MIFRFIFPGIADFLTYSVKLSCVTRLFHHESNKSPSVIGRRKIRYVLYRYNVTEFSGLLIIPTCVMSKSRVSYDIVDFKFVCRRVFWKSIFRQDTIPECIGIVIVYIFLVQLLWWPLKESNPEFLGTIIFSEHTTPWLFFLLLFSVTSIPPRVFIWISDTVSYMWFKDYCSLLKR